MHKKILHGLDGSEGSFKALDEAIDLAKRYEAELHTISIEELPRMPETIGEMIEEKDSANGFFKDAVKKARQMASAQGVERHSAVYDRVMGSTCQSLVRMVPCTVLVVK
ncbi:MAG: universal stress protein [Candidatus Kaiserbacteria bacterium]|nr:universal stress protein [Candidatus Kaiserbacteria bacterium]